MRSAHNVEYTQYLVMKACGTANRRAETADETDFDQDDAEESLGTGEMADDKDQNKTFKIKSALARPAPDGEYLVGLNIFST